LVLPPGGKISFVEEVPEAVLPGGRDRSRLAKKRIVFPKSGRQATGASPWRQGGIDADAAAGIEPRQFPGMTVLRSRYSLKLLRPRRVNRMIGTGNAERRPASGSRAARVPERPGGGERLHGLATFRRRSDGSAKWEDGHDL